MPNHTAMVPTRLQNRLSTLLAIALAVVHAIPVTTDGCSATNDPVSTCNAASLGLAVLGDSWASGVAYSAATTYDDNKDNCLRITEAYGAQLTADQTWLEQGTTLSFSFPACSGSRLGDIVGGRKQMSMLQDQTDVIVMTIGGNNAGFFDIASNCIYHQELEKDGFSYGNPYESDPDRSGLCANAIDVGRRFVANDFASVIKGVINATLQQDVVKANPDMKIYFTGYAEFFNLDDDWCDGESFNAIPSSVNGSKKAFLSHVLRSDMNDLTDNLNNVIQTVTAQFAKQNVRYVSINEGFEGHRFCEKDSFHFIEYYGSNVWFWNLSPPLPFLPENANTTAQFDDQGQFLAALTANGTATVPASLDLDLALATPLLQDDDDISATSNTGKVSNGWRMRPFHPKLSGHGAIKDAIVAQLKADMVPGVQQ
jgi:hypothetical protein